jgi:Kdo2-lipid IVA lauroyltransferase/acyltransferase
MADNNLTKTKYKKNTSWPKIVLNSFVAALLYLISLLPFRLLYCISDILYLFLRHVLRYRRKVIMENITNAFPDKTQEEINIIAGKFYHHLADLIVETIKLRTISEKQLDKRISYKNLDLIDKYYSEKKSIIMLAMHHNNWEWFSSLPKEINHRCIMLYNPVRGNKSVEKFLIRARERWGGKCIAVNKSTRLVMDFNRKGIPTGIWLGADQTSPATSKFWTYFLNREAPFFSGPEKIAVKTNQPVLFHRIRKTGRGYYEATFIPLIEKPKEVKPKEILLIYIRKMEEIIRAEPEYYLWSHRRWKHKRPQGIELVT